MGNIGFEKNVIVEIKILMNLLNFRKDIAEECVGCIARLGRNQKKLKASRRSR